MFIKKLSHKKLFCFLVILIYTSNIFSQTHEHNTQKDVHPMSPSDCGEMVVWDFEKASCMPLAMKGMPMSMWMIHGNAFLVESFIEGPRGDNQFALPNMLMGDIGTSLGESHYINVDLMLTFEKWTFPKKGYPELLQIGEKDKSGNPYVDHQHPHSSPIMGLSVSDTITLGGKDHLKLYFAPRGQTTDGPIAFMHRATGMSNPDAPLGHHVGQDVSHITSTVLGSSLHLGRSTVEVSFFNGTEPEPTEVDLPIDKLNSASGRLIFEFSNNLYGMASVAYVKNPEHDDPTLEKIYRYSSSIYYDRTFSEGLMFHNTFIFGLVNFYDHYSKLRSFGNELLLHSMDSPHNYWGRIEVLERGAEQLQITGVENVKWVEAITLGYTYDIFRMQYGKIGIGGSLTKSFIPSAYESAYDGDPMTGKVFIQLSGMRMGNF